MKTTKLTMSPVLLAKLKQDKVNLRKSMAALRKSLTDYKTERKAEWKAFKNKFNSDLVVMEDTLKSLPVLHKK